jgi:hypothetical protein
MLDAESFERVALGVTLQHKVVLEAPFLIRRLAKPSLRKDTHPEASYFAPRRHTICCCAGSKVTVRVEKSVR